MKKHLCIFSLLLERIFVSSYELVMPFTKGKFHYVSVSKDETDKINTAKFVDVLGNTFKFGMSSIHSEFVFSSSSCQRCMVPTKINNE